MITVQRRLLSEEELVAKLDRIGQRYGFTRGLYESAAAERMSDLDAMKWTSLCAQLAALRRRRGEAFRDYGIPSGLLSIYGMMDVSKREELENSCDTEVELAA